MMNNKHRLASGISTAAVAVALCVAQPAYAQSELGTLQGHVDGAKAGEQVVAVDTHTGQQSVGRVDAKGNYVILGVRPSDYRITAGGQTQEATLQVGQTVTVDFVSAAPAEGGRNIVVTGRRSSQPAQAQTVATNITPAQIENLPQNSRNFLSFATLAPGITLSNPSGAVQLQAGALNADHSNVLLDGMSFKNPINHGGMFGQNFGDFGNPFPQVAIQEYQIQTQNFGAEVGQSAGAVLSAITKTGGDHFHGSIFGEWQPKAFISKPHYQNGPKQDYDRKQFGGDIGGPIIPGKLTFYAAFEGVNQKKPAITFNVNALVPQSILDEINGSAAQEFKQRLYFGKLTWFATPDDTVNLIGYKRDQSNLSDFGGNASQSHGRLLQTEQTRFQGQWRHSAGNFLNFLNIAHNKANQGTPNITEGPEFILSGTIAGVPDIGNRQAFLGANSFQQYDIEKSWIIKDDATYRAGDHTLKAGGEVTFYKLSRTQNDHFNATYYVANPCNVIAGTCPASFDITTAAPYAAVINIAPTPTSSGKDTQVGLYIQDEWKPNEHWTINAGLRWDFESNANNKDYVTPPAIAAALRSYQGWAARGIDPEDYISDGNNRKPFYGEFQPRFGVAYDVHGDRDLIIFGGAGRYYDRSLFIEGQIEQFQNSNIQPTVLLPACAGGSPPAYCHDTDALRTFVQGMGFTGGSVWVMPNKLKIPYSDQYDLGIRKRFGDIQASLTYSHIYTRNIFMYARANFFSNGWYTRFLIRDGAGNVIGCTDGGDAWIQDNISNVNYPACPAMNGQLTGFSGRLNRGLDNGRAKLDAIYLHIEKPFTDKSTWGFTQSLTLQRARTNIGQDPFNQDEMFNGARLDAYGWNYLPNVPKWSSVTSATWRAPYGITLSGLLTLNSGPAFGHIVFGGAPDNACCFANFAGVDFPHRTFGYKRLDLRVAKTFKLPWWDTEITADFEAFNVFNWVNHTYGTWGAGSGNPPPNVDPNSQVGNDQRQFQAGLKFKF
jgi:hypothetical protein